MPSPARLRSPEPRLARWRRHATTIAGGVIAMVAASVCAAADPRSVPIDVAIGSPPTARVEHVFGGRSVSVPIVLYGGPGNQVDLKGRLFQRTPTLSAPMGDDTAIASGVKLTGLRRELTFEVAVPAVERESAFELVVFLRVQGDDTWRRAGSLSVRAYPGDLLEPLRHRSARQPLRVRDGAGTFERFLRAQGVSFVDLNARSLEQVDPPAVTLLIGGADDLALAKERARRGEAVIVFRERVVAFPRVELARWGTGAVMVVEFEVADRLSVDPRAQKDFLELLGLARSYGRGGEEEGRHEDQDRR